LLDADFFAFPTFTNQPPAYYAPSPGRADILSEEEVQDGSIGDAYGFPTPTIELPYQSCIEYPPFRQLLGFESLDSPRGGSPTDDSCIDTDIHHDTLSMTFPHPSNISIPLPTSSEM
jgi:hypothetical protein